MTRIARRRPRIALLCVLALVLSVVLGSVTGGVALAKKKKAGGTFNGSKTVNQAIPDATATSYGMLTSTISVGKKFKGMRVRDVNVTLQTTGTSNNSAGQVEARLTAPNGATTWLFGQSALDGQMAGPLTFDDQSINHVFEGTPAPDSTNLAPPYVGTVQPDCYSARGVCSFSVMNEGPVKGTWTLRVYDAEDSPVATSTLNGWSLRVVAGKPFAS
jgi:subtilisin-like proprotein convertase family protein